MEERVQKLLAAAGLCSRRRAEEWIAAGRVRVNGRIASLGQCADPARDRILVDGRPLRGAEEKCYLMLNKPRGVVSTLSDERGRPTVAELVRDCGARVFPVGRLDVNSEGLLLMTNDGAWAQRITHPAFEVVKVYHLTVMDAPVDAARRLAGVTEIGGERIRRARVRELRRDGETALLAVSIHEGKNRQIRRMCEACGLRVARLKRVQEHTLSLGHLRPGAWRDLREDEVRAFFGPRRA